MKFNSFFSLQDDDYYNDEVKENDDYYDDGNQGGEFLDYSDEYRDDSFDYPEKENNPVLEMTLTKKNGKNIKRRLDNHHCQALSPLGTGESCQSSIECRCGEFCSTQKGVCEPALCDNLHQAACEVYPGFNSK